VAGLEHGLLDSRTPRILVSEVMLQQKPFLADGGLNVQGESLFLA
jgi:hypothetical protein